MAGLVNGFFVDSEALIREMESALKNSEMKTLKILPMA